MENKTDILQRIQRAAAYIRVSTQEQVKHGYSLDAQRERLQKFADDNNIEIVEWYADEGVSAMKTISKRPGLTRMLDDAKSGRYEIILFVKLDRFFRTTSEYYKGIEMLGNIRWMATEEDFTTETTQGRMMINIYLAFSQAEVETKSDRIKFVFARNARAGIPMRGTSHLPFCYANPKPENGERRKLVKRNEEAMMALIEYVEQHNSIRGGMDYINQQYGLNLSYRSVSTILRNPLICGEYRGNINYCEPYISRERFQALQKTLERNCKSTKKNVYIFQGLIRCPMCGCILAGNVHNSVNGKYRYQYISYRCPNHRIHKRCDFATVVFEAKMEELLLAYIDNYTASYSVSASSEAVLPRQKIDTKKLHDELSRIQYAWDKGRLSVEEYDKRWEDCQSRIKEAEAQNAKAESQPKLFSTLPANWKEAYKELSKSSKRDVWKSIIDSIEIDWNPGKDAKKEIASVRFL